MNHIAAVGMAINDNYNYGGYAVSENVPVYERVGLRPKWCEQHFDIVASQAASATSRSHSLQDVDIHPISKVQFHNLLKYDTSAHVFPRQSFLEKRVFAPNCFASVALNDTGDVVGYAVVRTTLRKEDVGPLFADNSQIARGLYDDICTKAAAEDPRAIIAVDVPYGNLTNPDTLRLVNELLGKPSFKCMRMYRKGVPSGMPVQKIFGITAIAIG